MPQQHVNGVPMTQGTHSEEPDADGMLWKGDYSVYGVTVNALTVEELFEKYQQAGFLYEKKWQRLKPFWPQIYETWRRTMEAPLGQTIHHVVCCNSPTTGEWASASFWKSTPGRIHSQHLVSVGRPTATRQILLSSQDYICHAGFQSTENWFRSENRYPARVFGSVVDVLGPEKSTCVPRDLLAMPCSTHLPDQQDVVVERCASRDVALIHSSLEKMAGSLIAGAEELHDDLELEKLDAEYQVLGLRRFRRVYLAWERDNRDRVAGIAIAYCGPIGLNFSFLENRCELWTARDLPEPRCGAVVTELIRAARSSTTESGLPFLPITCDPSISCLVRTLGAEAAASYLRCIWLRSGFAAWYRHVDSFYYRLLTHEALRRTDETTDPPTG